MIYEPASPIMFAVRRLQIRTLTSAAPTRAKL